MIWKTSRKEQEGFRSAAWTRSYLFHLITYCRSSYNGTIRYQSSRIVSKVVDEIVPRREDEVYRSSSVNENNETDEDLESDVILLPFCVVLPNLWVNASQKIEVDSTSDEKDSQTGDSKRRIRSGVTCQSSICAKGTQSHLKVLTYFQRYPRSCFRKRTSSSRNPAVTLILLDVAEWKRAEGKGEEREEKKCQCLLSF